MQSTSKPDPWGMETFGEFLFTLFLHMCMSLCLEKAIGSPKTSVSGSDR